MTRYTCPIIVGGFYLCFSSLKPALSEQDLHKVFEVFMGQFRQLFDLKSDSIYVGAYGDYNLLTSEIGFTEW